MSYLVVFVLGVLARPYVMRLLKRIGDYRFIDE